MSDEAKDRLKEFRSQYGGPPRKATRLAVLQLVVVVVGFAAVIALLLSGGKVHAPADSGINAGGGLAADTQRDYAAYLAQKNLGAQAIEAYEAYLDRAALSADARAKVCYGVAKLAMDEEDYETALSYLYQSELLAPESELSDEISKKIVLCLDKLGRAVDLRHELRKRSAPKRTAAEVGAEETVLAEFAGEVITDRDLDLEIEKLPASVRDAFEAPDKKAEMLKNMVAERLLLDKAHRLELDKDPEIEEMLAEQRDAMMVRTLIDDEVRERLQYTPEDVERFYKAEPDLFTRPATADVSIGKAPSREEAEALDSFPEETVTVREGGTIPGLPRGPGSAEAVEAVFSAEADSVTGPVEIDGEWYVFRVVSKTPARLMPFDEVKDQAERMFRMRKEQELIAALIDETLEARDVRLYLERLQEVAAAQ